MFDVTKEEQEGLARMSERNKNSDRDKAEADMRSVISRARVLHRQAEQAGVPAILVAALLVSDAVKAAAKKIK